MKGTDRRNQIKSLWEEGLGTVEISRKIGIASSNISVQLNKIYGKDRERRFIYKRRLYNLNESFFENIDTEAKSYFLGLLAADGNLTTNQNLVRIGLHEKDKEILEKFCEHLNYTRPLKFVKKSRIDWNRSNQYLLAISSSIFRKSLEKHGLTPNKSLTMQFPKNIDTDIVSHFIRGYFDGDGCIHIDKRNHPSIIIASSELFCNEVSNLLKLINIRSTVSKHHSANCYYVRSFGTSNIFEFYKFMYKDATIFLERKKEIFDNWIKQQKENNKL